MAEECHQPTSCHHPALGVSLFRLINLAVFRSLRYLKCELCSWLSRVSDSLSSSPPRCRHQPKTVLECGFTLVQTLTRKTLGASRPLRSLLPTLESRHLEERTTCLRTLCLNHCDIIFLPHPGQTEESTFRLQRATLLLSQSVIS